jgi:putative hydrolase of the HAD superfamily
MNGVILWDFDGTLAFRPEMWRGVLIEVLDEQDPAHSVDVEAVRPFLRDGFPWHTPDVPHPELSVADQWWAVVEARLAQAYEAVGYEPDRARELARLAHVRYVDPAIGWRVFDDTEPVLRQLTAEGWRHAILSNHVPELTQIVDGLGLGELIESVVCSAAIGYEKPHPEAFACALRACGQPERVWMVGDSMTADVAGAKAVGIPAILVRGEHPEADRQAPDLVQAARILAQ